MRLASQLWCERPCVTVGGSGALESESLTLNLGFTFTYDMGLSKFLTFPFCQVGISICLARLLEELGITYYM